MPDTALLVGSIAIAAQGIELNGGAHTFPAGTYYLRHPTAALSLLDQFLALLTAEGLTNPAVELRQDLLVRATSDDAFSIDWLSATTLRSLLGWAGNSASSVTHSAVNVSPLLWSPGDPATPSTRAGTSGYVFTDQARHGSADGTSFRVDVFHEQRRIELSWTNVAADLLQVAETIDGGGTFFEFFEQSAKRGYSMFWHAAQSLDGTSSAIVWEDVQRFGPYVMRDADPDWYARNVPNADIDGPLEISLMQVGEYT